MEYAIGSALAAAIGIFGTLVGFDRERSFYPVVLIVIAALYLLFAVSGGSKEALVAESVPALAFIVAATIGFRLSPWIVVAGLALHGLYDFVHPAVIANPGVPAWWPGFCLAYDVVAAAYLGALIVIRRKPRRA